MPLKKEPRKRLLFYCRAQARLFSRPQGAGSLCSPKGLLLFCAYRAQGDSIAARQRCILFPALAREGERRARRGTKGGILFSKRIPPLNPPEKDEGRPPSTPDIASLGLEELLSLRNRVRCTWLRHESSASRYVLQSRLTVVRRV